MIGAFFDVDGTLYTAHMWRGLVQYAAAHGRKNQVRLLLRHADAAVLVSQAAVDQRGGFSQAVG